MITICAPRHHSMGEIQRKKYITYLKPKSILRKVVIKKIPYPKLFQESVAGLVVKHLYFVCLLTTSISIKIYNVQTETKHTTFKCQNMINETRSERQLSSEILLR